MKKKKDPKVGTGKKPKGSGRRLYARKIQILTVMEQRAKVQKKPKQAAIAKRGKESIRKQHNRKKV